jgi:hypothetical protein
MIGAGVVAVTAGVLVACAHDKGGQAAVGGGAIPDRPDWNWDVRPILSQNCFFCHGQAAQKGGVRLDVEKAAYAEISEDKGHRSIVPGDPGKSELFRRISTTDSELHMPPKELHKTLSPREIAIIERWIKQGARYKQHWAYIQPVAARAPSTKWNGQAVNEIDRYVYAKLAQQGLSPSPEADKETLINRVYLDLTGLPPTLQAVDAFVADASPNAYEKVVDRLLASREYAERQTNIWLDVARYADSRGGLNDGEQSISYPYRDWVISAFQRDMPYDTFVTWQLAGDKLPNATREQILATNFVRAGRKDNEGGSIDEEYRINYVQERTELVGKAFLGLTVGCAKCHDHKYDVISKADYYSLGGFFNQMDERGLHSGARGTPMGPTLEWPTALQSRNLAAAHAVTAAKEQAYQDALRAAQAKAQAAVNAVPDAQRANFVQASIQADTQAYYPFDDGYKASFQSLYLDPQAETLGVLPAGKTDPYAKMTRSELTAVLQKKILADVRAGKPVPMVQPPPAGKPQTRAGSAFGRRSAMGGDLAAHAADPGLPRIASQEIDWAMEELIASGYTDQRLGDPQRISVRQLPQGLKEEQLLWTKSGLPGGAPGVLNNIKFVPGHKGQGVLLHDSVFAADKSVGMFERTQPYSMDFWVKLRSDKPYVDSTRPEGPAATILYNAGGVNSAGYEITLTDGRLGYQITHNAPVDQIKVSTLNKLPTGRWVHLTTTYDGNSKAAGMKIYVDAQPANLQIEHDHLTRSAFPRGVNSQFGNYMGLASGANFTRPELVDGALDELRVVTRALTPLEIAYLQDPAAVNAAPAQQAKADMARIQAQKDPAVQKAWADLTDARLAEQKVETPIFRLMVAGDQAVPRTSYVLDRGIYNSYIKATPTQAPTQVFAWSDKLPRNRLGLAEWLFDPKQPLTARVYMNRVWQGHFGTGIVQTVDDFGTQGAIPSNPELLDYLAVEFVRSGWDIKHMHKLIVMSAAYRQTSNVSRENLEKDPRDIYLERGPRFRMPAEVLRDNALEASGLLLKKAGGDAVFPYAPDAIWDGVAQGAVIYPTNVPDDQMHRRSMYTYIKRNAPVANLVPFDMPDRNNATVVRSISNTPLQALVLLNDTQFMEAYRKVAERAIKSSANPDQQLVTMFRLAVRRHPTDTELASMKRFHAAEVAWMSKSPVEVKKLLTNGVAPADPTIDPVQLAAMTVVTAGAMNTPDAYTLR